MARSTYPSDLSDREWQLLEPLLPPPKPGGRPLKYPRREIVNAIRYVLRTGCAWRMLPHDLSPWRIVFQDRDGARLVLQRLLGRHERLRLIWADGAYGGKLVEWARTVGGWSLELVRRPAQQRTFQVLPRRWVVERTFGWLNLQRRLSKDYEALCETTETWLYIAMTGLMLRRLAHGSPF